jgi:hypothetical protein
MAINSTDVIAWTIVMAVTTVVLYQGTQKYDQPDASPNGKYMFYGLTILAMMFAFTILAFFKTGYSYDSATQTCIKSGFGYWKYSSADECLKNEKKDPITGLSFFQ